MFYQVINKSNIIYIFPNITWGLRVGFLCSISIRGSRSDPGCESLSGPVARVGRRVSSDAFWVIQACSLDWSTLAWDSGRFEKDAPTICMRLMKLICCSWNRRNTRNMFGHTTFISVFPINYLDSGVPKRFNLSRHSFITSRKYFYTYLKVTNRAAFFKVDRHLIACMTSKYWHRLYIEICDTDTLYASYCFHV